MTDPLPELKGISGGVKQKWLRLHRLEVLAYNEIHGEAATRERYNLRKQETWDRLKNPNKIEPKTKLTKVDKAIARAEIAEEGLREVRREVKGLKEQYGKFVPLVADEIKNKVVIPLLSGKIELPPELEYNPGPDPLDLTDFVKKLEKGS